MGYRAALEDAAKLVCEMCRKGEPMIPFVDEFTQENRIGHGKYSICRADRIHAALAAEADKDKGEERT